MKIDTLRTTLAMLHDGANVADLQAATGRSRATIYRDISELRALGVKFDTRSRRAGFDQKFVVLDWGPFDPGRV